MVDADGYLVEESAVLSACAWAVGRLAQGKPIMTGFSEDALDYADDLHKLTGVTRILADSIRNAVPDAVSAGVTAAVTTALGAVGGPFAAAGGAMAGSMAGKLANQPSGRRPTGSRKLRSTEGHGLGPASIRPRSPGPISVASPSNSPGDSA